MPSDGAQYAIGELAGLAGATPRTIRYYVAQGLLPAPVGVGPGAHYTDDHLARLRLIRRLQRQHQPLSDIRQRVSSLGEQDVAELLADEEPEEAAPNSALEYLRGVLSPQPTVSTTSLAAARPAPGMSVPPPRSVRTMGGPALFRRAAPLMPRRANESSAVYPTATATPDLADVSVARAPAPPAPPAPPAVPAPPAAELRSQWDRIALTPNIEIHVRRPLGRLENRRVERLVTIARQLLREEQP